MKDTTNDLLPVENSPIDRRKNNGGARIGAGRKSQNKVNLTFSINEDIAAAAQQKFRGKLSAKIEAFLKIIVDK